MLCLWGKARCEDSSIKMIVKIHKSYDGKKIVAVCDSDLVGKKFEDGKTQLDMSGSFYKGEERSEGDILKELRQHGCLNVVGEESVRFFVDKKMVDPDKIIRIKGIPHAQCMLA